MTINFLMTNKNVWLTAIALACLAVSHSVAIAQDTNASKPVPLNRGDMLHALESLKHRQPRLPLPPTTVRESSNASQSGSLGIVNNGLMRSHYLPNAFSYRRSSATSGLPYDFTTELFWIVSRVNNCHYCLGHQEHKLAAVGVTEETLLKLDTDWTQFDDRERAAFEFTRLLTTSPHQITQRDVQKMQDHFSDLEILEIAYLVGRYNSTNRWTDSLGIPQEAHREYESSLDASPLAKQSIVATVGFDERSRLTNEDDWMAELQRQSKREPRLQFVVSNNYELPHEQLLAAIPSAGAAIIEQYRLAQTEGELPVALREKIAFVAARHDQAWYMQNWLVERMSSRGLTSSEIFQLGMSDTAADAEAAALAFTSRLTMQPQSITDREIDALKEHYTQKQIAEIVYHIGLAAMLNRVTETAGI
jgi:alkylhydroperoxidase family enzyme